MIVNVAPPRSGEPRTPKLSASVVAGGLTLLAGVAVWQLGVEFERAWIRSYDAPLVGEEPVSDTANPLTLTPTGRPTRVPGGRRRWVAAPHARRAGAVPRASR